MIIIRPQIQWVRMTGEYIRTQPTAQSYGEIIKYLKVNFRKGPTCTIRSLPVAVMRTLEARSSPHGEGSSVIGLRTEQQQH
jgi:hypothetical protein